MAATLGPALIEGFKSNPKERLDMILEPLQVMIQLAILGFCPRGTKISINENILTLQRPTFTIFSMPFVDTIYGIRIQMRRFMTIY